MSLRALVVDDHDLARTRLRELLAEADEIDCVGEVSNGPDALEAMARLEPDVVFLDVQMPGMSGIEVLRRASPRPLTIFTTAYDRHAVEAFELHALDYLLKPFGAERLGAAIRRAHEHLAVRRPVEQIDQLGRALERSAPLDRIFVRRRDRIEPVVIAFVERLEAQGDYVELCEAARSSLVRTTLDGLLTRLDPAVFVRIHRSHAINLKHVAMLAPYDAARLEVVLRSGHRVVASRSRSPHLRALLSI